MNEDTKVIHDLIRRLLEAFIDHPTALIVDAKELPGRVDWKVKVHADDYGKVAGRQGAHIQALQLIVTCLGATIGEDYRLALLEPDPGPRRGRSPEHRARSYEPISAVLLLQDILGEILESDPVVEVAESTAADGTLCFTFRIKPASQQDRATLCESPEPGEPTLITALGALYRAYANKDGVTFILEEWA
jgi:predicted RNA-binding protein YlqC (UPF0109 family)